MYDMCKRPLTIVNYDTCKRPLTKSQKRYERCQAYGRGNKCVFNMDLKRSSDSSGF